MLRFSIFGIPVVVEGWFWLTCILLGGGFSANEPRDWMFVAIWTAVVFVSIMVHELGHALVSQRYGVSPAISLHWIGGATHLPGSRFSRTESIAVSAAGPAAGMALAMLIWLIDRALAIESQWFYAVVHFGWFVNFYWTLINLLPIQPLDGGQILREVLGPDRARLTSWIGFAVGLAACIASVKYGRPFLAVMLGVMAYYNLRQMPVEGGVMKS